MELSFITGGCNAVYYGHVYTFDRKKDSRVMYWQCKGKQTLQCKARLYSQEKNIRYQGYGALAPIIKEPH